jgi:putative membrane protein insertion efficiency factor
VDTPLITKLSRLPATVLILLVRGYRFFLSPWLGSACRFEPTCSAYSLQALEKHGAAAGTYLTLHRLVRCGPWCPGGHDPVPEHPPRLFAGLTGGAQSTTSPDQTAP